MQIDIRLVRPEDAAQIIEYAKIVGAETDCLILDENGMPGLTIEKEADLLRQLPTEHSAIYGAFCGTLPIGIANIQGSNRERIAHRASIGISVRRDYWRQGIGSRLMEALITFAERSPPHCPIGAGGAQGQRRCPCTVPQVWLPHIRRDGPCFQN